MKRTSHLMRVSTVAAAMAVGLVAASIPAGASSPPPKPSSKLGVIVNVPLTKDLLDAAFTNEAGKTVHLGDYTGDTIFLVPFLSLCEDTCPFTTGNLLQMQAVLKKHKDTKVLVVTISTDPYRDTPARIAAYAKLIGSNFEIWTPQGTTTTPVPPKNYSGKDSVGTGDENATLTAFEKFFGWQVQVVKEGKPAGVDWMAPHEKLTYDINHSDGFWVINSANVVRFESGDLPNFHGKLAAALVAFLSSDGKSAYKHPYKGWTPTNGIQVMSWVAGKKL